MHYCLSVQRLKQSKPILRRVSRWFSISFSKNRRWKRVVHRLPSVKKRQRKTRMKMTRWNRIETVWSNPPSTKPFNRSGPKSLLFHPFQSNCRNPCRQISPFQPMKPLPSVALSHRKWPRNRIIPPAMGRKRRRCQTKRVNLRIHLHQYVFTRVDIERRPVIPVAKPNKSANASSIARKPALAPVKKAPVGKSHLNLAQSVLSLPSQSSSNHLSHSQWSVPSLSLGLNSSMSSLNSSQSDLTSTTKIIGQKRISDKARHVSQSTELPSPISGRAYTEQSSAGENHRDFYLEKKFEETRQNLLDQLMR